MTSATLLANMPGFDDAVRLASECPRLGVGVHLNVLRGRPVSDAHDIPSLLTGDGAFLGTPWALVRRIARGGLAQAHLCLEFEAQLDRVLNAGIDISHVDSEKHLHTLPNIFRAAVRSAAQKGVRAIRLPTETPALLESLPDGTLTGMGMLKSRMIRALALANRGRLTRSGLATTDHFFGIAAQEHLDAGTLRALARVLPPGTCEVTCHPGYVDDELLAISAQVGGYWINRVRENEIAALTDPAVSREFSENAVTLISFRDLPSKRDEVR